MPIHAGMPLTAPRAGSPDATSSHRGPGPGAATRRRSAGRCRPGSASPGWSGSSVSWPPRRRRQAASGDGRPDGRVVADARRGGHDARRLGLDLDHHDVSAHGRGSAGPAGATAATSLVPSGAAATPGGAATPASGSGGFGGAPSAPSGSAARAPRRRPRRLRHPRPASDRPAATSPPTTPAPPPPPPPPPDCCSGGS